MQQFCQYVISIVTFDIDEVHLLASTPTYSDARLLCLQLSLSDIMSEFASRRISLLFFLLFLLSYVLSEVAD